MMEDLTEEPEGEDDKETRRWSMMGIVEVLRRRLGGREEVSLELGEMDRRGRSTMEGLPEKMTDTTRAVSSWLPRRVADFRDCSLLDSHSKSEKSSADEEASSSEER